MPKGIVILKWTMEDGLILMKKFPEEIDVSIDDMMRAFYAHITGSGTNIDSEKKCTNVVVRLDRARINISSYFTGMQSEVPYMINLILDLGEDPEMFGNIINDINDGIFEYLKRIDKATTNKFELIKEFDEYLTRMFDFLQRITNLSKEQKFAQIYSSDKAQKIISCLQEGPLTKQQLKAYLEENLDQIISNLELTLDPMTETGIVKEDWIKGHKDQYLFLLNDFTILRGPATKIVEAAKKNNPTPYVATIYLKQVREFFSSYKPTKEDSSKISTILMHPDKYDILRLFTFNSYNYKKIPTGFGVGGEEMRRIIDELIQEKILTKIVEGKSEWVMLLSDVDVHVFFPEYMLEEIRKRFNEGKIKNDVAVKHLELLEKAFSKSYSL